MNYLYRALSKARHDKRGTINADDERDARNKLMAKGLHPLAISPNDGKLRIGWDTITPPTEEGSADYEDKITRQAKAEVLREVLAEFLDDKNWEVPSKPALTLREICERELKQLK